MKKYIYFLLILSFISIISGCDLFKNDDKPTQFTVTFKDYDGTVFKTEKVEKGKDATAPVVPEREGYIFAGWDKAFTDVSKDLTITATYTEVYTVVFKDFDGTVLSQQQIEKGSFATAPQAPVREGYTFDGWSETFTNVTSDLIITATYTVNFYTITFKDSDGTVLSTLEVESGQSAEVPENPVKEGFVFTGWEGTYTEVTEDTIVTATYVVDTTRNLFLVLYTSNNDTVTAQVSLLGDVNVCGFEGYIGFDPDHLTYVSHDTKPDITSNYVSSTNKIYFVYTNTQDFTQDIPIVDITFTINDITAVELEIIISDIFDQAFNDETYSIIH